MQLLLVSKKGIVMKAVADTDFQVISGQSICRCISGTSRSQSIFSGWVSIPTTGVVAIPVSFRSISNALMALKCLRHQHRDGRWARTRLIGLLAIESANATGAGGPVRQLLICDKVLGAGPVRRTLLSKGHGTLFRVIGAKHGLLQRYRISQVCPLRYPWPQLVPRSWMR